MTTGKDFWLNVGGGDMSDEKGPGRGRGAFTAKGAQAAASADIEALKALVADFAARLDALEADEETQPTEPEVLDPEVPFEPEVPVEETPA